MHTGTLGSAKAMSLDHLIGNFEVGKAFDAIVMDAGSQGTSIDNIKDAEPVEDLFHKLILIGDDRNISSVFVQGEKIFPKRNPVGFVF